MKFSLASTAISATILAAISSPVSCTVPIYVDSSPWEYDIVTKESGTILSGTVEDSNSNIRKVWFKLQNPDGSTTSYTQSSKVSSEGALSTYELAVDTSTAAGKYGYKLKIRDGDGNVVIYPDDGTYIEFVAADNEKEIVAAARSEIESTITDAWNDDAVNLAAKLVRHGFHDCVGGCDGCVDMENDDNAGLDVPMAYLEPVVSMFSHYGMTRADIWVLAALEGARGTLTDDTIDDYSFDMEWIGRTNCEDACVDGDDSCDSYAQDSGPHRDLPSPNLDTHELIAYFRDAFDFDERDTVAIMGAHTLGTLARENSGFNGTNGWVGRVRDLDNLYYYDLVGGEDADSDFEDLMDGPPWEMEFIDNVNSGYSTPDRWQWSRNPDSPFMMVNSDMAIVRDLSDGYIGDDGEVADCQFKCNRPAGCTPERCPYAEDTFDIVAEYAYDNDAFLVDFEDAFKRMLNQGFVASSEPVCVSDTCTNTWETIERRNLRSDN